MGVRAMSGYWSHVECRWIPAAGTASARRDPDPTARATGAEGDLPAQPGVPELLRRDAQPDGAGIRSATAGGG